LLKWCGIAATVAMLAACSEDGAKPSKVMSTGPNISPVVHTSGEVDLIDGGSPQTINGAIWNSSAAFSVGTGNLNPFLNFQDAPQEEAFNTDASGVLDVKEANTESLPLNHVPVITIGGVEYREFILDANESNSAPNAFFSIDFFNLWLCDDPAAPTFTQRTQFENNVNCDNVYNLGGKVILATDDLSKGSGNGYDYRILIPETLFEQSAADVGVSTTTDCSYNGGNSAPCGAFLILDTHWGGRQPPGCSEFPDVANCWITDATFEEFSTLQRPWVTVTKTAVPSFKRRQKWLIEKSVSPTTITQFNGQSTDATWTITATPNGTEDFEAVVSGTITVTNTSGDPVTVNSVSDAIPGYPAITPVCTGVTFPVVIANNNHITCTYSVTPPDTDPGAHINTATAVVVSSVGAGDATEPASFKGTATFNFATATPSEIVDQNPNVYDNAEGGAGGATTTLKGTASQSPITYTLPYECGSSRTVVNVARLDLAPTGNATGDPTDDATLTINCLDVTVTKTANVALTRTYLWTIAKSADPAAWNLFNGDNGTTKYTVTVAPASPAFTDAEWVASGSITIHNPNSVAVYLQSKPTDVITSLTASAVTCQIASVDVVFPYTLAAGADLVCTYTKALPDATARTNTATVTAKPTPTGTNKDFSGTAAVSPGSATLNEVNKTVHVTDNFDGGGAVSLGAAGVTYPNSITYNPTHEFSCPTAKASFDNTAKITETNQTSSASVAVTCRALTVTKTAPTKYRRKWTWSVEKSSPDETSATPDVTLDIGQTYNIGYDVLFTSSAAVEDNFRIEGGTITVTNPAGSGATAIAVINSVSDVVSGIVDPAVVTCSPNTFPQSLNPGSSLSCTYATTSLPDKTTRTNTATSKRQARSFTFDLVPSNIGTTEVSYSSTATNNVTFSSTPSEALDECVNISDTYVSSPVTGKICAGDPASAKHFTYNRPVVYAVCGPYTVENTASFTSTAGTTGSSSNTATPLTGSDPVTISIDVRCPPQGCTLTQGYWKTHNVSFKGGAPPDDAWLNIGSGKEVMGFFTDGTPPSATLTGPNPDTFTWFSVFWTPPKGDAFYNLAHQWMAAVLNVKNGATPSQTVADAISGAEAYFHLNGPKGKMSATDKAQLITWAGILGNFNEGKAGVDHCSEDFLSSTAP
jgi:hypothetical protein